MALQLFSDPFLTDVERAFQPFFPSASDLFPSAVMRHVGRPAPAAASFHPMDVVEHADRYSIVADAPGMEPDNIRVELVNDALHVSGEKRTERKQENQGAQGVKVHRHERTFTRFSRTFALPDDARADGITAKLDNGVLTVDM